MSWRSTRELAVDAVELFHVDVEQLAGLLDAEHAVLQGSFDLSPVLVRRAVDERVGRQVAGQADAAGDDDVRLGANAPEPFAAISG